MFLYKLILAELGLRSHFERVETFKPGYLPNEFSDRNLAVMDDLRNFLTEHQTVIVSLAVTGNPNISLLKQLKLHLNCSNK